MGDSIAKIVMGMLVVIFGYNMLASPNTKDIIGSSASGGTSIIAALEGKK